MNPIRFAMGHPITMMMLVVALFGLGGLAICEMRIDIFPEFNLPEIYIIQNYNGMSPDQIEGLLVNQIELNLQYVDGIKNVESRSIQQIALIEVSFFPGTDMAQAMAAVVAQVNRAAAFMPKGVLPPQIMRMDAGSVPIGYLVLTGKTVSLGMLADLAEFRIRPLIQTEVPGTVGTAPFGSNIRSIVVTVDPDRLRSYNLTPEDVAEALMTGNVVIPSGNLYLQDQMPMVLTNAMVDNIQRIGEIPLRKERNLYIRDAAIISDSTDINFGYAMVDGQHSIYIPIVKKNTASTLTVVHDIREAMPRFQSVLPEGVEVRYEFDQSPTVVEAIRSVAIEGAIGAGLTGLMVLIFLRDWRSVIVVVFNIPLALLGSMFALWCTGNTTNIMTLGGLALAIGILVDEATVELENVHAQMEHVATIPRAVRLGNSITAVPRLLALLCILSVFIPAFIMPEPIHSLFVPLALAVGFAMIASYLLSSTLVPVLATMLLKGPKEPKDVAEGQEEEGAPASRERERPEQASRERERPEQASRERERPEQASRERERPEQQGRGIAAFFRRLAAPLLSLLPSRRRQAAVRERPEDREAPRGGEREEGDRRDTGPTDPGPGAGEGEEEWLHPGFFGKIQRIFVGIATASVSWRWVVVPAYLAACLLVLVFLGMQLGRELFPVTDMGQFVLRFRMPPGTNYELTRKAWVQCLHTIEEEAGPGNVEISMGFAGQQAPDFAMNNMILFMRGPDDGQMRVKLRKGSGVSIFSLQDRLRKALPERLEPWLAGVLRKEGYSAEEAEERARQLQFGFQPGDIVSEVMSFGSPTPIEVLASSPNQSDTRAYQEKVLAELRANPFLRDVQFHQELDYPTVDVRIDRSRANLSGTNTESIGKSVMEATSSSRMLYRNYWIDKKSGVSYQVQVQTPISRMTSVAQVETLPLRKVSPGINLMVRDVAHVRKGFMAGEIDRTSMQRYLSITANIEGEDLGRAARQIEDALRRAGRPPRGVHVEQRGQVKPMNQMFAWLAIGLTAAVFVIFVMLTAYFQSPRLAISALGAVPGVLSGVVVILYLTNTTLNIESFMGTIMSVGVSVSNSVMLVTFMAAEWQKGLSVRDSAVRGAGERLRPILMTACAMTIGMVPMSLGLESGSKMEAPLGMAVIGGLVMSTFSTLLVLPAIFTLVLGERKFEQASIDPDDRISKYYDGGEEASRQAHQRRRRKQGAAHEPGRTSPSGQTSGGETSPEGPSTRHPRSEERGTAALDPSPEPNGGNP
jgi:multidrug efflux pump subunit AcrB